MKRILLLATFVVFGFTANAQETKFGVKAGADFASLRFEVGGETESESETGFYVGLFAEIGISDSFIFQPEVLFVAIEDFDQINIPLMAKFGVSDKFDLLVGPSLGILLDTVDGMKSFNYGIEAGCAYDITEKLFIEARYNIGLPNLIEDAPNGFSARISGFFVGLGYKF